MAEPDLSFATARAAKFTRKFGIARASDIDLDDIAFALGARVDRTQSSDYEGTLVRYGNRGWITVNTAHGNLGRERFSIGHEIGHWILHPTISQLWLCTEDDIQRYAGSIREIEANAFSAELLLPKHLVRPVAADGTFGFPLVDHLANEFQCSVTASALRLSSFAREKTIVVVSTKDRVLWSRRGRGLAEYCFHIPRDLEIKPEARAYDCSFEARQSMRWVPTEAWFDLELIGHRTTVFEASRYNETLDTVLSLLVIQED